MTDTVGYPLSPQQELLHRSLGESPSAHVSGVIRIAAAIDEAVLRRAVEQLVARHEILRTRFVAAGRDPATLQVCDALGSAGGSVERTLEQVPALAEVGVTIVRAHLRHLSKGPDTVIATLEEIVRRFEPMRSLTV